MKIQYNDGSYFEIKDSSKKIEVIISATDPVNKKKLVVNSVTLTYEQMIDILNNFNYIKEQ